MSLIVILGISNLNQQICAMFTYKTALDKTGQGIIDSSHDPWVYLTN